MLRSAAKNFARVAVATDPSQYAGIVDELDANDGTLVGARRASRCRSPRSTASPSTTRCISDYLSSLGDDGSRQLFPAQHNSNFVKVMDLRYGENPHQHGAFYRDLWPVPGTLATFTQLQGKELSFNNLADADAAWECVRQFERPACVIVKHANPCGVAEGSGCGDTYEAAYATDPTSAFGGIIAFNRTLDARDGEGHPRPPVRRSADRAGFRRRRARLREEEGQRPRAAHPARRRPQQLRRQARRLRPADADQRHPRSHPRRTEGRRRSARRRRPNSTTCCSPGASPST